MRVSLELILGMAAVAIAVASGTIAFVPLYKEAYRSSSNAARDFSVEVAAKVSLNIINFLSVPVSMAETIRRASILRSIQPDVNESIAAWLSSTVAAHDLLVLYYLDSPARGFLAGYINTLNVTIPPLPNHTILAFYNAAYGFAEYRYVPNSDPRHAVSIVPFASYPTAFNHTLRPYYNVIKDDFHWVISFVDWSQQFADVGIGGPVYSDDGERVGIFMVLYRASTIIQYFSTLKVAATGRAFLVDVGVTPHGAYLGGTSSDPTVVVTNGTTVRLATPLDISDPVSRRAVDALGSTLYSCSDTCQHESGSGSDDWLFITVNSVTDAYGLNLRVVVVIPAQDFLGPIRSGMIVGIVAAICAITGLLCLVGVSLHLLLRPLKRLEAHLYQSATLRDFEQPTDAPSMLSEIFVIETAYKQLVVELKKVRSFLPQSVLRQLEASGSHSDETHTAADGSVANHSMVQMLGVMPSGDHAALADDPRVPASEKPAFSPTAHRQSATALLQLEEVHSSSQRVRTKRPSAPSTSIAKGDSQSASTPLQVADKDFLMHADNTHADSNALLSPTSGAAAAEQNKKDNSANGSGSHNESKGSGSSMTQQERHTRGPVGSAAHDGALLQPSVQKSYVNLDSSLQTRRVSIVMGNLCGFHKALGLMGPQELHGMHATVAQNILAIVNTNKGVLDQYHGDRFTVSFNASVACHNHTERACAAILSIASTLSTLELRGYTGIRLGCSTGPALCGTFGPEQLKRFCVVGAVVNQAFALMQQTKLEGVLNLISASTSDAVKDAFVVQHVDFVMLPQSSNGALISTLVDVQHSSQGGVQPLSPANGGHGSSRYPTGGRTHIPLDVIARINEAFRAFAQGDIARARELHAALPREHATSLAKSLRTVTDMRSSLINR